MQKHFRTIHINNNDNLIKQILITIIKYYFTIFFIISVLYIGFYLFLFLIIFFGVSFLINSMKKL